MQVTQEQLDKWREVMRRVCVGSVEVQAALAAHNRPRVDLLLGHLGSASARAVAQMDHARAQPRASSDLPADGTHDTPANRRYFDALRLAMYAAQEVDAERPAVGTPTADLVQMLMAEVTREIFGPSVQTKTLFGTELDR